MVPGAVRAQPPRAPRLKFRPVPFEVPPFSLDSSLGFNACLTPGAGAEPPVSTFDGAVLDEHKEREREEADGLCNISLLKPQQKADERHAAFLQVIFNLSVLTA